MTDLYDEVLSFTIHTAREAGELIRAELHRPGGPRGKPGSCPVDEEAEVLIRDRLRERYPEWPFFGEETGLTGSPHEHHWLVDPHDGTSAFQQGHRGSSVSIALLRRRDPVLGVVLAPCPPIGDEDLIAWAEGCGPVRRNGEPIERIWPSELTDEAVVLVSQGADRRTDLNAELASPARFLPTTSIAYRLALAAAGEGDVALSLADTSDYDFAAAHAILIGAGGELLDARGNPLRYAETGGRAVASGGLLVGGAPEPVRQIVRRPWHRIHREPKNSGPFIWPRKDLIAPPESLDRGQGVLLGQLVGDALGAQVEFQTADQITATHPNGVRSIRDGGPFNTSAGQPTDDSEMALALARSLAHEEAYSADAVANAYVSWSRSDPFDIGNTVRTACRHGALAVDRGLDVAEAMRTGANPDSQANGALMRISPVGIIGYRSEAQAIAWAVEDARLTHPHPVCLAANAAFVAAIAAGIRGAEAPETMLDAARRAARDRPDSVQVLQRLDAAESSAPARMDAEQMGWVLHALQNAFFELLNAPSFEAGLVATVGRGGDTDTNAAIAGALLGARHGATGIPAAWRRTVLTCRPRPPKAKQPRPIRFWPVDALEIAARLLCVAPAGKP